MDPLRTLLIDCRIELRKLVREFHKTELCERLDAMVQTLQRTPVELDLATPPSPATQREIRETANQVALAWQAAARDLKFSNAPLYEAMQKKVMQRLEAKTLVDPVDEIRALEKDVERLHAQLAEAEKATQRVETERNAVLGALATAVPQLGDGGDRLGVALARLQWLQDQVQKAAPTMAVRAASEAESRIPGAEVLALVASGARRFTDAQREWCVGEAMVLSNFQFTPMELIAQGDARIATIIRDARSGHGADAS
jgi:chromosome segregation ATPase